MDSIGRYKIIRELGRGAMGVVYLAEDPAIGRQVAIKTINLDNLSEPGQEQMLHDRLRREARSAGILSHPGIVTVYDIQHSGNLACIVMEFVEGVTLYDRMISGDLQPDEALSIMEQSSAAIDYAHSKGVLHRDIKPANLMFTTTGQVKVADFGVARLSSQKTVTTGMVLGTPSYMAPEQISSKPLGPATDQFSLAVMGFELLTGQKPFDGDSISGLLYSIVFSDPVPVRSLNDTLPEAVESVFRKALAKDPADRYPNCTAFARALRTACETRKTWKPVRTVRGSRLSVPVDLAEVGGTMPTWGSEAESPVKSEPEPSVSAAVEPAPTTVSQAPLKATAATHAEPLLKVEAVEPPALQRKSQTKKIAIAFAATFVIMLTGYMLWQGRRPAEVPTKVVAKVPAVLNPPADPLKEAPKKAATQTAAASATSNLKPAPVADEPQAFPVEFQTQPAKATVSVKDQKCVTPCQLDLLAGEYYVKAELDGHKSAFQRIQVPEVLDLSFTLQKPLGTIEVRGPAGATIYLNGKAWKDKAPARFQLEEGSYTIVLEHADGARAAEQKIDLTEGKIVTLN